MEWVAVELGPLGDFDPLTAWVVNCETCDRTWRFGDQRAAAEFAADHERYTDHGPDAVEERDETEVDATSVLTLIRSLESRNPPEAGVPAALILTLFDRFGVEADSVTERIKQLLAEGRLDEPEPLHYRPR